MSSIPNNPQLRSLALQQVEDYYNYGTPTKYVNSATTQSSSYNYNPNTYTTQSYIYKGQRYSNIADLQRAQLADEQADQAKTDALRTQYKTEYDTAYKEAKEANEARYNQALAGWDTMYGDTSNRYSTLLGNIDSEYANAGVAQKAEINRQYDKAAGKTRQNLISSGLNSTTVAGSSMMAVEKDRTSAIDILNENLRREKLGLKTNLSAQQISDLQKIASGKINTIENRTDEYPSENLYVELLKTLGNTNATY